MDRLVCLHVGEDQVEEGCQSQEEDELEPQGDQAGRFLCLWFLWFRLHGRWFGVRVAAVGGRSVVHVGPETTSQDAGENLSCVELNLQSYREFT